MNEKYKVKWKFFNFYIFKKKNIVFIILVISCGIPPEGDNTAAVPQNSLVYEQSYTYSCLTGYETSDSLTTQCQADGSWSLAAPTCNSEYH